MSDDKTATAINHDRYQIHCAKTLRSDLAQQARNHYEELSNSACHFNSVIPAAINAWECMDELLLVQPPEALKDRDLRDALYEARQRSLKNMIDFALRDEIAAAVAEQKRVDAALVRSQMRGMKPEDHKTLLWLNPILEGIAKEIEGQT